MSLAGTISDMQLCRAVIENVDESRARPPISKTFHSPGHAPGVGPATGRKTPAKQAPALLWVHRNRNPCVSIRSATPRPSGPEGKKKKTWA